MKLKARNAKANDVRVTTANIPKPPPKSSYTMPASDSSDQNDTDEPYSQTYHQQKAIRRKNINVDNEYSYSDYYTFASNQEDESSMMNDNSLLNMATPNPVSELKIVNVTSLPAEKHNEIMNNDDNAMNAMDSGYNHHLKISEIISTASNSNVFGIAKKEAESNSLLTVATNKPYHNVPNKSLKLKQSSKIQKLKQQMQNNYRLSGVVQAQNMDEASSTTSGAIKEYTDSDEHSNSKFNLKMNRRKNTLTPRDCEMEFVEINPPILKKQAHMTDEQRILSSQLETVKSISNPNSDLLRKVAFLRVCVDYMMTELVGKKFKFGKNITYESLKERYNSKRMESE